MIKDVLMPFEQALLEAYAEEFNDIPPEDECEVEFSPAFLANVQKINKKAQKNHWKKSKVILRRVALIAAILAALLLTACSIPAVREVFKDLFIDFFIADQKTHYEFTYDPAEVANAPKNIETAYAPTYLPDGFVEEEGVLSVSTVILNWCKREADGSADWITFLQSVFPDDPSSGEGISYNAENASTSWLALGGGEVLRIEDERSISYVWSTSEYQFNIICDKTVGDAEIQRIFNSIQINEQPVDQPTE